MTPSDRPAPPRPSGSAPPGPPPPYAAPSVTALGAVGALTAGSDADGNMDTLVGEDGGFTLESDPSS